jgi:hypothetical protein
MSTLLADSKGVLPVRLAARHHAIDIQQKKARLAPGLLYW